MTERTTNNQKQIIASGKNELQSVPKPDRSGWLVYQKEHYLCSYQ